MKLIQQLLEMAKSSTKSAAQAKRRRKKKSEKPTLDKAGNPVQVGILQRKGAGAGAHATTKDKQRDPKRDRRDTKVTLKDY